MDKVQLRLYKHFHFKYLHFVNSCERTLTNLYQMLTCAWFRYNKTNLYSQ